jgi:predicted HAD superfamily Cof-like phosphohydrolase
MLKLIRKFSNPTDEPIDIPTNLPSAPTIPDPTILLSQCKLLFEETMELLEACGIQLTLTEDSTQRAYWCDGEIKTEGSAFTLTVDEKKAKEVDLAHIAKEMADVSVVVTGLFAECGIADIPVLEEVDANNLRKFGPGGYLDEHRKWRKPPNHPKPDIKSILVDQGLSQEERKVCDENKCAPVSVPRERDHGQREEETVLSGSTR